MVSAVTHHPTHFIAWEMPLAQGLQYQAIWCELHGTETIPAAGATASRLTRYL